MQGRIAVDRRIQLIERRRLGAGAGTGAQLGAGLADVVGGGRAPGFECRDISHVIDASAQGQVQPLADRQLPQREQRVGVLRGRDLRGARDRRRQQLGQKHIGGFVLGARAIDQRSGPTHLQGRLIFGADAVACIVRHSGCGVFRQHVGLVGDVVEGTVDPGLEHVEAVGPHPVEGVDGGLAPHLVQQPCRR